MFTAFEWIVESKVFSIVKELRFFFENDFHEISLFITAFLRDEDKVDLTDFDILKVLGTGGKYRII